MLTASHARTILYIRNAFDPRDYSAEKLNLIKEALKVVQARQHEKNFPRPVVPT